MYPSQMIFDPLTQLFPKIQAVELVSRCIITIQNAAATVAIPRYQPPVPYARLSPLPLPLQLPSPFPFIGIPSPQLPPLVLPGLPSRPDSLATPRPWPSLSILLTILIRPTRIPYP
jgi:hypothetical protein